MDLDLNAGSRRRQANVFDATAGDVSTNGIIRNPPSGSYTRGTTVTSGAALPADEVLFKRKNAPQRYEERDIYATGPALPGLEAVSDSQLLKVLHAYISDFNASAGQSHGKRSWKSLDETALLALGILWEEMAQSLLDVTGDFALMESHS